MARQGDYILMNLPKAGLAPDEVVQWARLSRDAHAFIFGDDGGHYTVTKDEHRVVDAEQPFPDLPYLRVMLDCLLVSGGFLAPPEALYALDWGLALPDLQQMGYQGLLFIEKSRQIMASWLCCAYILWRAKFHAHQLCLVQSKKEEDAAKFVYIKEPQQARISFIESRLPEWLSDGMFYRSEHTIGRGVSRRSNRCEYCHLWFQNGSHIWAVPQGGDVVRSNTPSVLFSDEAGFQPDFGLAYQACLPAIRGGGQGIFVSSAEISDFSTLIEADV